MQPKSIKTVIYANQFQMGELLIRQPLPSAQESYFDPFILLHHGHVTFENGTDLKKAGVGPHPHRGFSPVTFVFKGGTHHRDSRGNDSEIYEGGTQWMHAGMGIMHSERPLADELEIIQLWINSPAKNKMDIPHYYPLKKEDTPLVTSTDGLLSWQVVSGTIKGVSGKIPSLTPIDSAMLHFKKGGLDTIQTNNSFNTCLYILKGSLKLNGKTINALHLVTFENDGDAITIECEEEGYALFLSGSPIAEKIETHGPFVMNTSTQIMEAYRDYQMGKMGLLIED